MPYSNAKAVALIRDLGDKLSKRLAFSGTSMNTVATAFYTDSNGDVWPYLLITENGNAAEGQPVLIILITGVDAVSKDIFGNQTEAYAPHLLQLGYELQATPNIGDSFVSHADKMACIYESIMTGVRIQLKEVANGTAVTAASVVAATPVADMDDMYWPTKKV